MTSPPPTAATGYPAAPVPAAPTPARLRAAIPDCRACDLHAGATQAVLGEGAVDARLVLVGEQPGDREDIEGHPFVGPAGSILDAGLERACIARDELFVTNAVKHFRYKQRGKRRIHQRPDRWQMRACQPWLSAELHMVAPEALVLLGATAAQAVLGRAVRIGDVRGQALDSELADFVMVTAHPSSILRARDPTSRARAMDAWVTDLEVVAAWLAAHPPRAR